MQVYFTLVNAQSYMRPDVSASELKAWASVLVAKMPKLLLEARDFKFIELLIFKLPWLNFSQSHG